MSQLKRVRKFTELLLIVWIEKKESLEKVETNRWVERNENEDEKMKDQKKKKKVKQERREEMINAGHCVERDEWE
jgi:hypothetical protein